MAQTDPSNDVSSGLSAIAGRPVFGPGASQDSQQVMLDQLQTAEKALKDRYENPNWFNVAAGFLKPQLGGFAASLGSASQALGENVEKQRANEIPLFNVRAQVGALQAQMRNRQDAGRVYDAWDKGGRDPKMAGDVKAQVTAMGAPELANAVDAKIKTRQEVAQTAQTESSTNKMDVETRSLLSDTPESKQRLEKLIADTGLTQQEITNAVTRNGLTEQEIREAISRTNLIQNQIPEVQARTASIKQGTTLELQNALNDNLFITAPPGSQLGDWTVNGAKTRDSLQKLLVAHNVYNEDNVKGLTNNELQKAYAGLQNTYVSEKIKNRDTAGQVIEMTDNQLKDVGVVRDFITSPRMARMLGIGSGSSAVSALFGYIANPTDGTESALTRAAANLSQDNTPEGKQAQADFDVLKKHLQRLQLNARNTMANPSVAAQTLTSKAEPSTSVNTQLAMVKMVDLMAHDISLQNRTAQLRLRYGGDYQQFQTDPKSGYGVLNDQGKEEHSQIAVNPSDLNSKKPDFYYPSRVMSLSSQQEAAPASRPSAASSTGPKEGDTAMSRSNKPMIFRNGQWEYK